MPTYEKFDSGQINVGDVLIFDYKSKYKTYKVHDNSPQILYLGVSPDKPNIFHGINLNYLNKEQINKIREIFYKPDLLKAAKIDANPKAFYDNYIQRVIGSINISCYRTYWTNNMRNIHIIGSFVLKHKPTQKKK